jgi:hypothetical protein
MEKSRLLDAWVAAAAANSKALRGLSAKIGIVSRAEYKVVLGAIRKNRRRAEAARKAFEDHVAEHGC